MLHAPVTANFASMLFYHGNKNVSAALLKWFRFMEPKENVQKWITVLFVIVNCEIQDGSTFWNVLRICIAWTCMARCRRTCQMHALDSNALEWRRSISWRRTKMSSHHFDSYTHTWRYTQSRVTYGNWVCGVIGNAFAFSIGDISIFHLFSVSIVSFSMIAFECTNLKLHINGQYAISNIFDAAFDAKTVLDIVNGRAQSKQLCRRFGFPIHI